MFQQTFHFSGYAPLPFVDSNNLHVFCLHNARTPDFSRIPACFLQKQPLVIIIYYAYFVNPFQVFPPEEKNAFLSAQLRCRQRGGGKTERRVSPRKILPKISKILLHSGKECVIM